MAEQGNPATGHTHRATFVAILVSLAALTVLVVILGVQVWRQGQRLDCWDTWHEVAEIRADDPDSPYLALDCWKDYE